MPHNCGNAADMAENPKKENWRGSHHTITTTTTTTATGTATGTATATTTTTTTTTTNNNNNNNSDNHNYNNNNNNNYYKPPRMQLHLVSTFSERNIPQSVSHK